MLDRNTKIRYNLKTAMNAIKNKKKFGPPSVQLSFDKKIFHNYLDLLFYMVKDKMYISDSQEKVFPHSKFFYIKSLLENKFNRKFTIREIKELCSQINS